MSFFLYIYAILSESYQTKRPPVYSNLPLTHAHLFLMEPVPLPEFSKESSNFIYSKYRSINLKVTSYV